VSGNQNFTSSVLYHLVGYGRPTQHNENLDTLRLILKSMTVRASSVNGIRNGICTQIDPSGFCGVNGEPIKQTSACFADIPLRDLPFHAAKYGYFGVGVGRRQLAYFGGRPVVYIPTFAVGGGTNNYLCKEALNLWSQLRERFPDSVKTRSVGDAPKSDAELGLLARSFLGKSTLAYLKPYNGELPDDHLENYYMEREWRSPGNVELYCLLRQIVAPARFHGVLSREFPHLADKLVDICTP
jgi:hypothetical protein